MSNFSFSCNTLRNIRKYVLNSMRKKSLEKLLLLITSHTVEDTLYKVLYYYNVEPIYVSVAYNRKFIILYHNYYYVIRFRPVKSDKQS